MEQKCPQCGAPLPSGVLAGLCPTCLLKQGAAGDTVAGPDPAPFQPPSVEEVAKLFPQLEIIALIGKGGMGAVYQARQPGLDRMVAIKILPPQTASGPGFVERFNREARALARLSHPNIVAVHEFGQVNGLSYFIMEYVDGLNLRELERAGKLSPREALQIVPQICEALQFAHDEGIVHRDIKPENILLDKKGRVKIADFGIAKILSGAPEVDLTGTQSAIGTPHYMAPEQMEKPTTVDHRADIFSLGVVFYEMLTGELPLGKFGPPSSRKVEVDVRLDDVVLRALEKDPDRRYQHASQVKTAVDTIVGSAAPPPRPPMANAAAMAKEILERDYTLNIRSCVRRAWRLLKSEFWPFVGITALILALLGFAASFGAVTITRNVVNERTDTVSSAVLMLVWGPLFGGLFLYFLKKMRKETATVETAFSGFSPRFLQLFLAGFVTTLLTWLGFLCLILPGIYLSVAWMFALPLVADKQLDFWSAMELSRKVVTKHWFKFLGLGLILFLLAFAGALALVIGMFITTPLILVSLMYAYEDVFGHAGAAAPTPAAAGPFGTVVIPPPSPVAPRAGIGSWNLATKIGLAAVVLVVGLFLLASMANRGVFRASPWHRSVVAYSSPVVNEAPAEAPPVEAVPLAPSLPESVPVAVFGPVIEREITNLLAINLDSGKEAPLPQSVTALNRGPEKDSAACAWMEGADVDLAYISEYDGFYGMTRDMVTLKQDEWDDATPDSLGTSLHDTGQDVPAKFGNVTRLDNPTNYTYGFKTRTGDLGLLQILAFTPDGSAAKIRYKLVPQTNAGGGAATAGQTNPKTRQMLLDRFDAASRINNSNGKEESMAAIAVDAAQAGEIDIAKKALTQLYTFARRDSAIRDVALLLAKHGMRKEAIALASGINQYSVRDATLAELAK